MKNIEDIKQKLASEVDTLEQYIIDQHDRLQEYYFEVKQSKNENPNNSSTDSHISGYFAIILGKSGQIRDPRKLTTIAELRGTLQLTENIWTPNGITNFRGDINDIRKEIDEYVAKYKEDNS